MKTTTRNETPAGAGESSLTVSGTRIEIDRAEKIFIYDRINTTCVVLFDAEGRKFIYEPEQITAIEVR